jgi:hypothetical protein
MHLPYFQKQLEIKNYLGEVNAKVEPEIGFVMQGFAAIDEDKNDIDIHH